MLQWYHDYIDKAVQDEGITRIRVWGTVGNKTHMILEWVRQSPPTDPANAKSAAKQEIQPPGYRITLRGEERRPVSTKARPRAPAAGFSFHWARPGGLWRPVQQKLFVKQFATPLRTARPPRAALCSPPR